MRKLSFSEVLSLTAAVTSSLIICSSILEAISSSPILVFLVLVCSTVRLAGLDPLISAVPICEDQPADRPMSAETQTRRASRLCFLPRLFQDYRSPT